MKCNCCGGKPTEADNLVIAEFKEFLNIRHQAKEVGLSDTEARRFAAIEVYGDEWCEGSR